MQPGYSSFFSIITEVGENLSRSQELKVVTSCAEELEEV
jgi:hypothetical protein